MSPRSRESVTRSLVQYPPLYPPFKPAPLDAGDGLPDEELEPPDTTKLPVMPELRWNRQ